MKRRILLAAAASTAGAVGTTGCLQGLGTGTDSDGTTPRDPTPDDDAKTTRSGAGDSEQSPGASQDDSREAGSGDPDWNSQTEPIETVAVGDRDSVAFPNSNHPHSVALWNPADAEREVRVDVAEPRKLDSKTVGPVAVPADAVVVIELNVPATYALAISVEGDEFGSVVIDRSWFDCNYSTSRYALAADELVDYGGISTAVACAPPAVASTSVDVANRGCASDGDHDATIAYDGERVHVDGTFISSNPCYDLALTDASYSDETRTATVVLDASAPEDVACQDCVGALEYHATVAFENDLPDHVTVLHRNADGETERVATASRNDDA